MEDLAAQLRIFWSLIGAMIAAAISTLARNVYHPNGFSWKRVLFDLPFAVTCAILAGSIGAAGHLDPIITYGIAGAFSYLGPYWLDGWLRKKADSAGKDGESGDGAE